MSQLLVDAVSACEMIAAGRTFAEALLPGQVIALNGDLGAGKTHFAKGVVVGLGSSAEVTSPTFSLIREYRGGRCPVFHFDFYRLETAEEVIRLDWDEYLEEGGVVLVEWADRFPELLPKDTIWLDFSIETEGHHRVASRGDSKPS